MPYCPTFFSSKAPFTIIDRTLHKDKSEHKGPLLNMEDITPQAKTLVILYELNFAQIPADTRITTINIESAKYFLQRQVIY